MELGTRLEELGTRLLELGAWNLELGILSPRPFVRKSGIFGRREVPIYGF